MKWRSYVFWLRGKDGEKEMETKEPIMAKCYSDAQSQYLRGLTAKVEGKEVGLE